MSSSYWRSVLAGSDMRRSELRGPTEKLGKHWTDLVDGSDACSWGIRSFLCTFFQILLWSRALQTRLKRTCLCEYRDSPMRSLGLWIVSPCGRWVPPDRGIMVEGWMDRMGMVDGIGVFSL